jgi:hypothetical protein
MRVKAELCLHDEYHQKRSPHRRTYAWIDFYSRYFHLCLELRRGCGWYIMSDPDRYLYREPFRERHMNWGWIGIWCRMSRPWGDI